MTHASRLGEPARRLTWGNALLAFHQLVKSLFSKIKATVEECQEFLDEKGVGTAHRESSRLYRFGHFWVMVGKSFVRNRCPVHASALAYTTLLALIPMLAVALSVSTSILKNEGQERISGFIDKFVDSVTPPGTLPTNAAPEITANASGGTAGTGETNGVAGQPAADVRYTAARKQVAVTINGFIRNTNSGTLGVTGTVLLVFVAISMLSRIESTFNDIWGVTQGRSWFERIWKYWGVITLGPILLALALGLTSGPRLEATKKLINSMPFVGGLVLNLLFQLLPVVVLCLTFALLYMLMPNTKVHWKAALAGGLVGGILWHLNSVFSVLYVSRLVTNSKLYAGLAMVPVFMVGLYFGWLILLFGAQVAYAYQNRAAYVQEKQCENVNQRGREFIALRLMAFVGQRFHHGERPATVPEIASQLSVPTRLVHQVMQVLLAARLVVEVTGQEIAYAPARPLESVTCHDILLALRAGHGQELATRDDCACTEVYGEFQQILEAERKAASAVTVLMMVDRTEELAALDGREIKAVTDSPDSKA
jgi:membrane protein